MDFSNKQIDIEQLPKTEQISYTQVEEKYKKVLYGKYLLLLGIPTVIATVVSFFAEEDRIVLLAVAFIFFAILCMMLFLTGRIYEFIGYAVRENDICMRSGLFFKNYVVVPFNRIQHITVEQGVLARAFGLASLKVYSAAGNYNDFVLNGITKERADEMKQFILEQIKTDDIH
ncbi:MAG: PH domain-containing protein [Ignavibacteria bacterium]|jgi:membrane protein YdbS with pleckstrin-like domain|nr:PH domain-containing protein [Ignavibacteria bacterium]